MLNITTYTGGIAGTNAHLITLPGGTLLVDAPEGVADWLDQRSVRVDALVLTHQHFDHCLDAATVRQRHGCPVYAWAQFARELTLERLFGAVTGSSFSVPGFEVNEVLEGRDSVEVCGHTWRLFHVPGHSPDSVCLFLEAESLLLGGDVLFYDSIGRTDFPGSSHALLVQGIVQHLWSLPNATRVLPGHGPETTLGREKAENPYVRL